MKLKSKLLLLSLVLFVGIFSCKKKEEDVKYGSLSGTVINSQTGEGLSNAKVTLTVGTAKSSGITVTTDEYGDYYFSSVEVGTYTCTIEATGFFAGIITNIVIIEGENYVDQLTIVQAPEAGSLRIILTWGEAPHDLDSHLTGPTYDGLDTFHLYFGDMDENIDPNVSLDVDNLTNYGPETTTITHLVNGTYRYSVFNYSDRESTTGGAGIASSPAKVEIYDINGLKASYKAPVFTGYGNTWRVFEIHVVNSVSTIVPFNDIYVMGDSWDETNFKSAKKK